MAAFGAFDTGEYTALTDGVGTVTKINTGEIALSSPGIGAFGSPDSGEIERAFDGLGLFPFMTSGDPALDYLHVGTGGVAVGGYANIVGDPLVNLTGTGGVLASGAATVASVSVLVEDIYPRGGTAVSGSATVSSKWVVFAPSGGTRVSGAATVTSKLATNIAVSATLPQATGDFVGQHILSASLPALEAGFGVDGMRGILPDITGGFAGDIGIALPETTGSLDGTLPVITGQLASIVGGNGGINVTLPLIGATIEGGAFGITASLPAPSASFTGTVAVQIVIAATLPLPSANLAGAVGTVTSLNATLPLATAALDAIQGGVARIDAALRGIAGGFDGIAGLSGSLLATTPNLTGALHGSAAVLATLATRLPPIRSANFTTVWIQAHHLTHVMNTITTSVTTFDNYEYNSFARFGGRYLAASPTGLHVIDAGDKDLTASINATLKTGQIDFGNPQLKRLSDFYVAMRSAGDISIKVSTDENDAYEYLVEPFGVETLKQRRVLIGKGMRGRYWQFELSNVGGGDFDFDAYSALVADTNRRV